MGKSLVYKTFNVLLFCISLGSALSVGRMGLAAAPKAVNAASAKSEERVDMGVILGGWAGSGCTIRQLVDLLRREVQPWTGLPHKENGSPA